MQILILVTLCRRYLVAERLGFKKRLLKNKGCARWKAQHMVKSNFSKAGSMVTLCSKLSIESTFEKMWATRDRKHIVHYTKFSSEPTFEQCGLRESENTWFNTLFRKLARREIHCEINFFFKSRLYGHFI